MKISQSDLKVLVSYESETGIFRSLRDAGRTLSGTNAAGYVQMTLLGQFYYGHRLAWFYAYGEWPRYIDHINGDKSDNRLSNLRACTHSQNLANKLVRKDSSSGLKGVQKTPQGRWKARIRVDGKQIHLGHFDQPEDAYSAYTEAATRYFGEFARAA